MMIFSPLPWRTTSAVTAAPDTPGAPTLIWSPSAPRRTSSKVTDCPGSTSSEGIRSVLPGSARYCLPPVRMMAYMGANSRNGDRNGPKISNTRRVISPWTGGLSTRKRPLSQGVAGGDLLVPLAGEHAVLVQPHQRVVAEPGLHAQRPLQRLHELRLVLHH